MGFYLDFKKISIDMFYKYLEESRLFETHLILKDNIDNNMDNFKKLGYSNLDSLYKDIKTQRKVILFAEKNNYSIDYLTVLRRHIMSLIAKPRKISDFSRLKESTKNYLQELNIKTTKDLYDNISKITCDEMNYLNSIVDLSRQRYMHATYLDGVYFSGYTSMKKLASAEVDKLASDINETMRRMNLTKAKFGLKDSKYIIDDANLYIKWLNL